MDRLTLDWLHVIALLGTVQGLFLAGALAITRRNRTANRLLAAAMLAFSVYLATSVYHAAGFMPRFPHFFGAAFPLPFLFGPLIYLYAVTAADRTRGLKRLDALHFVPFVAVVIAGLPVYLMSGADKIAYYHRLQSGELPLLITVTDPLKLISGVIYATITIVFLRLHRERVKESYSSTERVTLRWLLWLAAAGAVIWIVALGSPVLEAAGILRTGRGDDFVALSLAVLVYAIGYMALRQPEIFRYETAEYPVLESPPDATASRYERSGLTEREAERLRNALLTAMEQEQPWRESSLTLAQLATHLSTTPHKLSEVLNAQLGQSFYDFVNGYRVREVQRRITAGEARRLTILALALDAGFASKSTFNEVFKKLTSQTPSEYRRATGV